METREKETVKFSRCRINSLSLTVFLSINFDYIAKLKYLVLLLNGDIIILSRGRNSVLKYFLQKFRAPKN